MSRPFERLRFLLVDALARLLRSHFRGVLTARGSA